MRRYRIIQPWDWPRSYKAQVKYWWCPWWITLQTTGLSVEYARKVVENHRAYGICAEVTPCEPATQQSAGEP